MLPPRRHTRGRCGWLLTGTLTCTCHHVSPQAMLDATKPEDPIMAKFRALEQQPDGPGGR